ncbi:MAG: hypothetical protein H0X38_05165 [Planctomycetes bacterium]|nr:hypothetical protein [Planctomycetota bacterium]
MSSDPISLPPVKTCSGCRQTLPLGAFHRRHGRRDGHAGQCKTCRGAWAHARYERTKGRIVVARPRFTQADLAQIRARGEQRCLCCHTAKPLSTFAVSAITGHPRRICTACRAAQNQAWIAGNEPRYRRKIRARACRRYGITTHDFERMLTEQNHACAICGLPLGTWHQTIDHDHASRRVRGIVHRHCNLALGNAREDPRVLIGCLLYVRRHHPQKLLRFAFDTLIAPLDPGHLPCKNSA